MAETQQITSASQVQKDTRPAFVATDSVIGALAASSCCIIPPALYGLGATGAWIGTLTSLAPYQPIFVVITMGFLAGGFWMVYRKPKTDCAEGSYCARPVSTRVVTRLFNRSNSEKQ